MRRISKLEQDGERVQSNAIAWNTLELNGMEERERNRRGGLDRYCGYCGWLPTLTSFPLVPTVFPRVLLRTLRHPIFLLVVLSQVCTSSMVAGMATFLPKFLERQFSITASFANLLLGGLTIPLVVVGIMVGGVLVKRLHLSPLQCGALCLLGSLLCLLLSVPLFFIGCSTHHIAGITQDLG